MMPCMRTVGVSQSTAPIPVLWGTCHVNSPKSSVDHLTPQFKQINIVRSLGAHVATPLQDLCDKLHTYPIQCIPGNSITYALQSHACFWNIVDNKIGFKRIGLLLSLMLWSTLSLHWVATLVAHLLVELHAAHHGECLFQSLLTFAFTGASLGEMPWLPTKQLNGCTVSTLRTRRT